MWEHLCAGEEVPVVYTCVLHVLQQLGVYLCVCVHGWLFTWMVAFSFCMCVSLLINNASATDSELQLAGIA